MHKKGFADESDITENRVRRGAPVEPRSGSAAAPQPWTEDRINAGIDQLAAERGIKAPLMIKLMKSYLLDPSLMERGYRQEINLLLQAFGLGATRVGSGRLEAIPTDFNLSDWPAPNEPPAVRGQRAPKTEQPTEEATWQRLLPLLKRRSVR